MPTINSAVTLDGFIHWNGTRNKKPNKLHATPEFLGGHVRDSSLPDSDTDSPSKRRVLVLPPPPEPDPQEPSDAGGTLRRLSDAAEESEEEEEDGAVFFDPRESMSVASSSSDTEDRFGPRHVGGSSCRRGGSESGHSDYYDAAEDSFSDGSFPGSPFSFNVSMERELQALKCNLIEEVEKRKKAEMDLLQTYKQWGEIQECLFRLGLSYHETKDFGNVNMPDPAELCQAIIHTRFVSDAVERDLAQAEVEEVSEAILRTKDREISRLRDRLQYYEAMNREMSQCNLEAVARQRHLRRKTRWRWIWGCVGLSITIGASLLAYSYLPPSVKGPLPTSSLDASSVSMTSDPDASSLSMTSIPDASSLSMTTSVETEGCCSGD